MHYVKTSGEAPWEGLRLFVMGHAAVSHCGRRVIRLKVKVIGFKCFELRNTGNPNVHVRDLRRQSDSIPRSGQGFPIWLSEELLVMGEGGEVKSYEL